MLPDGTDTLVATGAEIDAGMIGALIAGIAGIAGAA